MNKVAGMCPKDWVGCHLSASLCPTTPGSSWTLQSWRHPSFRWGIPWESSLQGFEGKPQVCEFPLHEIKGTKTDSALSLAVCLWKTSQSVTFLVPVGSPITILITVYGNWITIENSIGHFWVLYSQSIHSSSISWGGAAARIILVWRHLNQLFLRVVMAHLSRPKQIPAKILPNIFGWFEWDQEHLATLSPQKATSKFQQPAEDQQKKKYFGRIMGSKTASQN